MTLYKTVADMNGGTLVEMTEQEEADFIALQTASQNAYNLEALVTKAQSLLDASDMTAIRCMKAGVQFPTEWQSYVSTLRGIVSSKSGTIPSTPAYPSGT